MNDKQIMDMSVQLITPAQVKRIMDALNVSARAHGFTLGVQPDGTPCLMPLVPMPAGDFVIPRTGQALQNNNFCKTLLSVMVGWNDGQPVTFTQDDFDEVSGMLLLEGFDEKGQFILGIRRKQ